MGLAKILVASLSFAATVLSTPVASPPAYGAPPSYGNGTTSVSPNPRNGRWVDTWTTMPQLTEFANLPPAPFNSTNLVFYNSTIRQTLRSSLSAQQIRIGLSNAFGLNDLPITRVTIALPVAEPGKNLTGASAINTTTVRMLTFSGNESIIIPDGALAVSDPLNFPIEVGQIISVTMYQHDYTTAQSMTDPSTNTTVHGYFLSAVEGWMPPLKSAFAVVGDSITDGRASYNNANGRWTDLLFKRMQTYGPTKDIAMANQAAGENRILYDGK